MTSSEFASLLATSGTSSAAGEFIGNSRKFAHLVEAFRTQWSDAALAARDTKARKSEAVVAAVDKFDLSGQSEAASRIDNAISWNDADHQINEYEDDDDEYCEEDVGDSYTCDCDDELDETAYAVGTPTDDPELLEQFDGKLEDADVSASQVCVSASRSFQEERELLSRVKSARGYFPVVGIGAFDGSHPLIGSLQSLVAQARRARGKGNPLRRRVESRQTRVHLASCQNHRPHVRSLVLRCPRSVRMGLAQLEVDHITLLVFVLMSACYVDKLDIVHQNVPTKEKRLHSHLANGHLVPMLWDVQCSMPRVMVQLEETEQDRDESDIEDFVAFSIRSLEGFTILGSHEDRFWIHECPTSSGSIRGHHD